MSTERVVKVTLSAQVAEYKKGMLEAANATRAVGTEAEKINQTREAMQTLGRAGVAAGAVLAAGLGVAVAKFAEFDQQMSYVAATGDDAKNNIDALREAAIEAGASTVFSASESANAIEELSKAGLSASQILGGGLKGSLDLAAAGGLGVAQAAEIAATTMQQFQLEGEDASHVADLLAAGAGKAMGDVTDMGQALNQAGLVASQFGVSVEESVGVLSAFASAGMLGSDAGTSFRTMLLRLANPTKEVQGLMEDLGIEAYNSQGQFIGLAGLAGELETGLEGMTQAQKDQTLAMIFGQDAIRGANILLREGEAGIKDWTAAVDDQGYAAETAATRLDNLKGDIEALQGALDSALITIGGAADGPLRVFVQSLTQMVDGFNGLPEGGQQAVFWIGSVAAVASTAAGAFLLGVPKVAEYKNAIDQLGSGAQRTSRMLGMLGRGVGAAAVAATVVTVAANALIDYTREMRGTDDAVAEATTTNQGFLDSMEALGTATDATADSVKGALDALASGNTFGAVGLDIMTLRDTLTELDEGLKGLPLENAVDRFQDWGSELGLSKDQMATLLDEMPQLEGMIRDHLKATGEAADEQAVLNYALAEAEAPAESAADAYLSVADEAGSLDDQLRDLINTVNEANGVGQDAVSANLDYRDALAEVDETIKKAKEGVDGYSLGLDDNTQAGRDNKQMLVDLAGRSQAAAGAQFDLDKNTDKYRETLEKGRSALIRRAEQLGMNKDEARALADQIYRIPSETEWEVIADTANAQGVINRFIWANDGRRINLIVDGVAGRQVHGSDVTARANGGIEAYANGGFPTGIYQGRPGGIHKFAEPETGWEAYISGKADQRDRNIGLWVETGRRLGVDMAGGGGGGVQFPDTITLVDADGSILTKARVIAGDAVAKSNAARDRSLRGRLSPA